MVNSHVMYHTSCGFVQCVPTKGIVCAKAPTYVQFVPTQSIPFLYMVLWYRKGEEGHIWYKWYMVCMVFLSSVIGNKGTGMQPVINVFGGCYETNYATA